jgi:hypothetical protein
MLSAELMSYMKEIPFDTWLIPQWRNKKFQTFGSLKDFSTVYF